MYLKCPLEADIMSKLALEKQGMPVVNAQLQLHMTYYAVVESLHYEGIIGAVC